MGEGKWGINVDGRDLTLDGECTIQCADNVLLSYILETCVVLLTNVTPINSIKHKKRNHAWRQVLWEMPGQMKYKDLFGKIKIEK